MNTKHIVQIFEAACLLVLAGSMTLFLAELFRNESTSLVDFRIFHETERDIYPSFSLCASGPGIFVKKKLKEKYGIDDVEQYINFLIGDVWDEKMLHIDYDDVTLDLKAFVEFWALWVDSGMKSPTFLWHHEPNTTIDSEVQKQNLTLFKEMDHFFISLQNPMAKCFTLDLSNKKISGLNKKAIGKIEIAVKSQGLLDIVLGYYLHYPGQLIAGHFLYDIDEVEKSYRISRKIFYLNMIEVIRRRDTYHEPCHKGYERHDEYVLRNFIQSAKCKPNYLKLDNEFVHPVICNDSYSMKKALLKYEYFDSPLFRKQFEKPCDQLQTISMVTKQIPREEKEDKGSPRILELVFPSDSYKEIRHIKGYSLKSCWADVSAIIGFVCGVSIWQIPDALKMIVAWMKKHK